MIKTFIQPSKIMRTWQIWLPVLFTLALQVQITILSQGDYLGLRIGLSDFLIPLCGLFVAVSLLLKRSSWPKWGVSHMWAWLLALLSVVTISLIQGYLNNGFWDSWAVFNKYTGFYLLLSYCALGGWLITNSADPKTIYTTIMKTFCYGFTAVTALSFIDVVAASFGLMPATIGIASWDGLVANRNAFAVLGVMTLLFWEVDRRGDKLMSERLYNVFLMLAPTFSLFNASRTVWIVGGIILLLSFVRAPWKMIAKKLMMLFLGTAVLLGLLSAPKLIEHHSSWQLTSLMKVMYDPLSTDYGGDQKRLIAVEDGLELYKQNSPILGAGLGTYKHFQIEKRGEFIDLIDFTALWIFVELGALGLIVFSGFFLCCLWRLKKSLHSDFHKALFLFMITFFIMSCLHELMYARFIWFFLGIGLAVPATKNNNHN